MRPSDIAAMCVQNLKRRRARTVLTALGVMVGTASIVIMVSIGFGLSEQTERTLSGQAKRKILFGIRRMPVTTAQIVAEEVGNSTKKFPTAGL